LRGFLPKDQIKHHIQQEEKKEADEPPLDPEANLPTEIPLEEEPSTPVSAALAPSEPKPSNVPKV
jgi:hypothetical protein